MEYLEKIRLRDGRACVLRNGVKSDGVAALAVFMLTHEQTDFLLSYPDESTKTAEQEGQYLQEKTDSPNEIEILAVVDGVVAENEAAISIYKKAGFVEFGRNPRGFKSRLTGYQEVVYMRKELS